MHLVWQLAIFDETAQLVIGYADPVLEPSSLLRVPVDKEAAEQIEQIVVSALERKAAESKDEATGLGAVSLLGFLNMKTKGQKP